MRENSISHVVGAAKLAHLAHLESLLSLHGAEEAMFIRNAARQRLEAGK